MIILSIYLATCFFIFNQTEEERINTKIKIKDNIPVVDKEVIGSIKIDKINLRKPLYKIESAKNHVEKNLFCQIKRKAFYLLQPTLEIAKSLSLMT